MASSQVSTRSYFKASVQCTPAPATTIVGIPTATPSVVAPDLFLAPSHSGVALPSVPRKRKAVAPDMFATSSEKSSSLSLIKNVNMEEFIEDLMKTKIQPPAYCCIQELIAKVFLQSLALSFPFLHFKNCFFYIF